MEISGNSILANLGLVPKPQPGGPKPQAQEPRARQGAQDQASQAQPRAADRGPQAAGVSQARNLEQAVQTLSDQGRLPPRGSLVDLRA